MKSTEKYPLGWNRSKTDLGTVELVIRADIHVYTPEWGRLEWFQTVLMSFESISKDSVKSAKEITGFEGDVREAILTLDPVEWAFLTNDTLQDPYPEVSREVKNSILNSLLN